MATRREPHYNPVSPSFDPSPTLFTPIPRYRPLDLCSYTAIAQRTPAADASTQTRAAVSIDASSQTSAPAVSIDASTQTGFRRARFDALLKRTSECRPDPAKVDELIYAMSLATFRLPKTFSPRALHESPCILSMVAVLDVSDIRRVLEKAAYTEEWADFALVYVFLIRELMAETIQTPTQLFAFLLETANILGNQKMTWLFQLVRLNTRRPTEPWEDNDAILNTRSDDPLELLGSALQVFVQFDNRSLDAIKASSTISGGATVLLHTLIASSYGHSSGFRLFLEQPERRRSCIELVGTRSVPHTKPKEV